MAVVKSCGGCKPHEFQDKQYGKNIRVFNLTPEGHRCTVCGNSSGGIPGKGKR